VKKPFVLALLLFPLQGLAQYDGPAVETCRAHAESEAKRSGGVSAVVLDKDRDLMLERASSRSARQAVALALHGNGAFVLPGAPAVEMRFVCLLADEKRGLFFHWLPRRDAPALAQCRRGGGQAEEACLQALLLVAEQDLTQLYALRFQEARETDTAAGNENAVGAFRRSNEAWRAYRDAECARRGPAGSASQRACLIDLTRRRLLDAR
jgi:uncharacterized protein YecT (DUF1311 family)